MGAVGNKADSEDDDVDDETPQGLDSMQYTAVPTQYFAPPVAVSMSGGTAQFFNLKYIGPASGPPKEKYGQSDTYWLGKDLERALDELPFYENLLKLDLRRYKLLRDWTMSYVGILTSCVAAQKETPNVIELQPRNLIVIHDIADGLVRKRMLDIKIGEETAVAGWSGKSSSAARRNRVVDKVTNSTVEGYRLEGFDNMPESLSTQKERPDISILALCKGANKKINRIQLQTMPLRDFCRYWDDFNDMEEEVGATTLTVAENSEAVMFDAIRQMAQLCVDAKNMPASQMWIGSSLCLACDSGRLLDRQAALQRLARPRPVGPSMQPADLTKVCVFDWGRSQLNTVELNQTLSVDEQLMRKKYWDIWQRGMLRAFFEATCLYLKQFCFKPEVITIEAWDFDSFDPNDLLGTVDLPLQPTDGPEELELADDRGYSAGTVTVEVTEMPLPSPSRLQKIWRVYVYSVAGLPKADTFTDTDPVVRVLIGGENACRSVADTPVIWDDRNAEIEHPLFFGQASPDTANSFLSGISSTFGTGLSPALFQFDSAEANKAKVRQQKFEAFLQSVPLFSDLARNEKGKSVSGM